MTSVNFWRKVILPDDYEEKLWAAKKVGDRYAHLDVPELKECRPRKRLGKEVLEQEVYGIDPYTYNLLLNTMPADTELFTEKQKQLFIEEVSNLFLTSSATFTCFHKRMIMFNSSIPHVNMVHPTDCSGDFFYHYGWPQGPFTL